jgi:hypothetical protein
VGVTLAGRFRSGEMNRDVEVVSAEGSSKHSALRTILFH